MLGCGGACAGEGDVIAFLSLQMSYQFEGLLVI